MVERLGQQLGSYRLMKRLGSGGFAEVYIAEHIYLKNEVAVKVLYGYRDEVDVEAFSREGRMLVKLVHPHIIRVLDFGVEAGTPFLVMDYASNGTLRQHYPPGTRMSLPLVVKYVNQVASALQYAHDQKLIHRDVKPENMLLDKNHDVLLSDFGVAIMAQSTHESRPAQQEAAGTIAYMAPESVQTHPRAASDQYALAVVAYEWICGVRPFTGSFLEIAAKHALTEPLPLSQYVPDISLAVEQVILTALAKVPEERFASVQMFADTLERAVLDPEGDTVALPVVHHRNERQTPPPVQLEQARQEPHFLAPAPAALVTPPRLPEQESVHTSETPPPRTMLPPRRDWSDRRKWTVLAALLVLLLLLSSFGVAGLLAGRTQTPGPDSLATATTSSRASPASTTRASPAPTTRATATAGITAQVTPSPGVTATLPPVDALPPIAGNYSGPIHNTPASIDSSMTLQITQNKTAITGQFTVAPPLSGSGPLAGTVSSDDKVQFIVNSPDTAAPLLFIGTVAPDHSMSGSYCSVNAQNECDRNVGGYGTWQVAKN